MSLPSEQNWLVVFNLLTDLNKNGSSVNENGPRDKDDLFYSN